MFNDRKFYKIVEKIITNISITNQPAEEKLEEICKRVSKEAYHFRKNKILEFKKKKEKSKNLLKSNNTSWVDKLKYLGEINTIIQEEIRIKAWEKRIEWATTNGPSKTISMYLKLKKQKNLSNKPSFLLNNKNEKLTDFQAANLAKDNLSDLYSDKPIDQNSLKELNFGKSLTEKSKQYLEKDFEIEEIKNSIKYTPNRATGPSGIPITLFKKFSAELSPLLCQISNEILKEGKTNDFLLNGNIILIPKKKESSKIEDLRPITLLEIPRKIITKAMTERIKKVLLDEEIIDKSQFCHPNRKIHENVLTLDLLIRKTIKNKGKLFALFLDYSKAFDRVNHSYLLEVLKRKNFGEKSLNFIKAFLGGNRTVDFNGFLSDTFFIARGVPQ
jgi:hypothetical protein